MRCIRVFGDLVSWFRNLLLRIAGRNATPVHIEKARAAQTLLDHEIQSAHDGAAKIRQMFRDHMSGSAKRVREHANKVASTLESADITFTYGDQQPPQ